MLKRIYEELVAIKKELQAIRSNLEFNKTRTLNTDLLEEGVENAIIHPNQVNPDSLARQLQPEQNGE